MEVMKAIEKRRSIRKFKPLEIPDKDLKNILEAARLAPSAGNRQPWRFIVVRDSELKKRLAKAARSQMFLADASVIIVAMGSYENSPGRYGRWVERDTMTATEHIVLTSTSMGYGTCWIGAFEEEEVKEILDIPEEVSVVALLPIGLAGESPKPRERKQIGEIFFEEKYGNSIIL